MIQSDALNRDQNSAPMAPMPTDDYFSRLFEDKLDQVKRLGQNKKILDLGCGTGVHLCALAGAGYDVTGIDPVASNLASCGAQWQAAGGDPARLRTTRAELTALPEPLDRFDLVYSFSTLYAVADLEQVLKEVARVLRPGGKAILELGNRRSLGDCEARRAPANMRHLSPGAMRHALRSAGLSILEQRSFQICPLYGGATPQSAALNAQLRILLAERGPDGRMIDERIASSRMLSPFAFRQLFVVENGPAAAMANKDVARGGDVNSDVNQAQNLTIHATNLLAAGKREEAVESLVRALAINPDVSAPAIMLAALFSGADEKRFAEHATKAAMRWMRMKNIPLESLSSTHPERFNPPTLTQTPPLDERFLLMRRRAMAAKTVVDLGCGGRPIPEATCAVDLFLDPLERGSGAIDSEALARRGVRFVHQAIDKPLPFADHEFDFAYSAHVFEHLTDPATACEEMMRIAKAGCVLTPYFVFDVLSGRTYHRWMMLERAGTLFFFEKAPYEDRPFGSWPNVFDAILNDGDWFKADLGRAGLALQPMLRAVYGSRAPLSEVCLNWVGRFEYVIVRNDGSIQSSRALG